MNNLRGFAAITVLIGLTAALGACKPAMKIGPAVTMPQGTGQQLTDADMPHPKPGLWSVHSAVIGDSQTCLSGQILRYFNPPAVCTQNSRQHTADGGVIMDSQCTDSSHTTTTAKGDFQSAFTVSVIGTATLNGAQSKMSDQLDYKYLGDCAAGQKPDDAA